MQSMPPLTTGTSSIIDYSNSLINCIACICVSFDLCPVKGSLIIFNCFASTSASSDAKLISSAPDELALSWESRPYESARYLDTSLSSKYRILLLFVRSFGNFPFGLTACTLAPLSRSYWTILTELARQATWSGVPWRGLTTSMFVCLHNNSISTMEGYILDAAICKGAIYVLCVKRLGSALSSKIKYWTTPCD